MSNDTRVPAGVPTGGQFAASAKSEASAVALAERHAFTPEEIEQATNSYVTTLLWSSSVESDEEGEYTEADNFTMSPEGVETCRADVEAFLDENAARIAKAGQIRPGYDLAQAGHDFALTRNGHGAGFWDRGLGEVGDELTASAKVYGSVDLYRDDNDELDVS